MQTLLGGHEIYHYHSKLMMKEAKTGGAHVWHQDYGYWLGHPHFAKSKNSKKLSP